MKWFFILLLAFASCQKDLYWSVHHLDTGNPLYDGSKLSYQPPEKLHGIQLEFYQTHDGLKLFLYILEKPLNSKEGTISVSIRNQHKVQEFSAYLFQGGQRLLASQELSEALLDALKREETLTLRCENYVATIIPDDFAHFFTKFQTRPLVIPIEFSLE